MSSKYLLNHVKYSLQNSTLRACYQRYAFEEETKENSLREGQRLEAEVESLKDTVDINTGKQIAYSLLPTMVDGKVNKHDRTYLSESS